MALGFVVLFCCVVGWAHGSAIPMWEYLTKDEKMAYLYNTFANQVDDFCSGSGMKNCNVELLRHGLKNLHDMPEDHLDVMDPYQRGANTMIWQSMMEGHDMMVKATAATAKPAGDAYDDYQDSNYLGSASDRHETVVRPGSAAGGARTPDDRYYGPMVVKVHPDGRPVPEEPRVPHDDDHHHYAVTRQRVPSLHAALRAARP